MILHTVTFIYVSSPMIWQTRLGLGIPMKNEFYDCCNPQMLLQLQSQLTDSLQTRVAKYALFSGYGEMIQHARFAQGCDGK